MQINKILVIAAQNRARDVAFNRAVELARRSGASIHLVGFCYDALIESEDLPIRFNRAKAKRQMLADTKENLQWLIDHADVEDIKITSAAVWTKNIHEWVAEQKDKFDIAVKTGHRTESVFYTPTDWHLLRTSPVPLLIVSAKRWKRRSHHVLATIDFGSKKKPQKDLNKQVLGYAAAMAELLESELHICYALPISKVLKELDVIEPREEERKYRNENRDAIKALADEYGISMRQIHIRAGEPEKVISGTAKRTKAELVVMGTLARKGLKAALIGNTSEKVLHEVSTDILAMRLL